ncbi:hypothetical protein K7X08_032117 [Anisodus acutangulus]|uniref:PAC domain-containing protein n=1 Tax=Anisodus acutangulus TaxID=402998 RepID=A0A9Q1MME6_9SOLA|nr:hypothetical protein K7X08_032117 [Anisodus acutangulus]
MRFLQGPETDPATVRKIRQAIDNQTDVTVQLINYTKTGKKFWNLFHLQPMRDQKGEVQYFIGVQLDGSQHVEPLYNSIPEDKATESAKLFESFQMPIPNQKICGEIIQKLFSQSLTGRTTHLGKQYKRAFMVKSSRWRSGNIPLSGSKGVG